MFTLLSEILSFSHWYFFVSVWGTSKCKSQVHKHFKNSANGQTSDWDVECSIYQQYTYWSTTNKLCGISQYVMLSESKRTVHGGRLFVHCDRNKPEKHLDKMLTQRVYPSCING